ncbi:hypothetical protein [Corynebacterium uterequi]|uniref:hypothetical protein n=1 Tax=Corynebacterium uterequi TaxID=1072256 RepID=UPI0011873D12|nr:hypothetical protein [Corynebacterium uterequi]
MSAAVGLLLTGCSDPAEHDTAPSSTPAITVTSTAPTSTTPAEVRTLVHGLDVTGLNQVDPNGLVLATGDPGGFVYTTDGARGECFFNRGAVTCTGSKIITLDASATHEGFLEGAPPAKSELATGDWVDLGSVACAAPDAHTLTCSSEAAAFTITGPDRSVSTTGTTAAADPTPDIFAHASEPTASAHSNLATDHYTSDVVVTAPELCGAAAGWRLAEVQKGTINCEEAMSVLDRYEELAPIEGTGNTLVTTFDGWGCSSPTYVRSHEIGASIVCEHLERGIRITDPLI